MPDYDAKFQEFHRENPQVYAKLVELARKAKSRGHRKIGIKMLWEVMRWELLIMTNDAEFKLNNNYHSRYARLVMSQEPDLQGMFETRTLKTSAPPTTDDDWAQHLAEQFT